MCATPLRSGFQGYCTFLNRCVGTCMRFSLLFEPLKIYHHIPADDLLQAVNSVTLARENIFYTHSNFSTDCTWIRNGGNHNPRATPLRSGFQAIIKGLHVFHRRFALYVTCAGLVSLLH